MRWTSSRRRLAAKPILRSSGRFSMRRPMAKSSGGTSDSMTLAIAHRGERDRVILDAVRERRPPFSPDDVVLEFAPLLKSYNIQTVRGDRYAGEWPRERFRMHGITYEVAEQS